MSIKGNASNFPILSYSGLTGELTEELTEEFTEELIEGLTEGLTKELTGKSIANGEPMARWNPFHSSPFNRLDIRDTIE